MAKAKADETPVEDKLRALFTLQQIDSKIDKIAIVRGELPLEVQSCADVVAGLETRLASLESEKTELQTSISDKKNLIKEAEALIKKYTGQQDNVRNNREYESLSKEIEYQTLEIQLAEKRIREAGVKIDAKELTITETQDDLDNRKNDLAEKQKELDEIVAETEKDEAALAKKSVSTEKLVDDRLLNAYKRIRSNAANGLAVVSVDRDSCGGCFNKIPPQRQLDIRTHKKVIVCEHCGRILVNEAALTGEAEVSEA